MDSYKHSCPFCGQHIEYTVGYCGKQMVCPICQKTVTFPAIPPRGKGQTLRIKRPSAESIKLSFDVKGIIAFIRQYEHWNIVWAGVVPFVIIAGLLIGAIELKKHLGDGPAIPTGPIVHAEANAWQKMTDLARADQVVQQQVAVVNQARAAATAAQQHRDSLYAYYQGKNLDPTSRESINLQLRGEDQSAAYAQAALTRAKQSFETVFQRYQKLGGTIDYHQQLPP
jgi:hypothetical protein